MLSLGPPDEPISDTIVLDLGNKAWVGLDEVLRVVSTDIGPDISFRSMLSLEGGLLYRLLPVFDLRRSVPGINLLFC